MEPELAFVTRTHDVPGLEIRVNFGVFAGRDATPAELQLLISAEQTIRQLRAKISAVGAREGATIRVAPRMEARLTGLGFKIQENTPEVQAVGGPPPTVWTW